MARFLICCTPVHGHLSPLLRVAQALAGRRHEVVVLTGSRFEEAVTATGSRHVSLPAACDYDDRDMDGSFPGRAQKRGAARLNFDVSHVFADPIPHQYRALEELRRDFPADALLVDTAFIGAMPLALSGATGRPPIVVFNVLPLSLSSRDTAPFGFGLAPSSSKLGRARNAALGLAVRHLLLRPGQRRINQMLESVGSAALPVFFMDGPKLADRLIQPTVPAFEYPRSDLAENVRFVGPVLPPPTERFDPPNWWADIDATRPVVLVTQGTIDTADLGRLILPTLSALEHEDVLVIATTGGHPGSAIPGPAPANARIESYIPFDQLLPKVDVMVTNGGYGGVHFALSHGVPLVVAGATEDKPEVAARVAWAGVGINLRTGKPTARRLRSAVREVMSDPSYRHRARSLQTELARHDAVASIAAMLEELATKTDTAHSPARTGDASAM
jgi:MGT family glycosyltransferase